jgi:hypothetical protein
MNAVCKDGNPNSNNMNHSGTLMYQLIYADTYFAPLYFTLLLVELCHS